MINYAQLNDENICIGISQLTGEVEVENMVQIEDFNEDYLWRKYENGQWSEEKFYPPVPEPEPKPAIEDFLLDLDFRLSLIELGV